jgi:hypothetical protein
MLVETQQFFLPQAVITYNILIDHVLFHLPSGILFTFPSQYTNLTNNALDTETNMLLVQDKLLKRFTTSIIQYSLKIFNIYTEVSFR